MVNSWQMANSVWLMVPEAGVQELMAYSIWHKHGGRRSLFMLSAIGSKLRFPLFVPYAISHTFFDLIRMLVPSAKVPSAIRYQL